MGLVRRSESESAAQAAWAAANPPENRRTRVRDVPGLVAQLHWDDPEARRRAALDLGEHPDGAAALVARVGVETDPAVRDAVLTQLARLDLPEVATGLLPYLASDDAPLRNAVVSALAAMPASVPALVPSLLGNPDPDVRILSIMVVAGLRVPQVEGWLCQIIENDWHANVVAAAVNELVPLAGPEAIEVLDGVPSRFPDDPFLAFTVSAAVKRLRSAA